MRKKENMLVIAFLILPANSYKWVIENDSKPSALVFFHLFQCFNAKLLGLH